MRLRSLPDPKLIWQFLLIVAIAYAVDVGALIPFVINLGPGSRAALHDDDVAQHMMKKDSYAAQMFHDREDAKKQAEDLRQEINRDLQQNNHTGWPTWTSDDEIKSLSDRLNIAEKIAAQPLPYGIKGWVDDKVPYLVMINFCFITVLFCLVPRIEPEPRAYVCVRSHWNFKPILLVGFFYFVILELPPWLNRYWFATIFDEGRRSFASYNWDIDPGAYVVSKLQDLITAFMLAALWIAWSGCLDQWRQYLGRQDKLPPFIGTIRIRSNQVSALFDQWLPSSMILAMAYAPWTYNAWTEMQHTDGADARNFYFAWIDHLTWMGTWALISAPLIMAYSAWQKCKVDFLVDTAQTEPAELDTYTKLLAELEPISPIQRLGAIVAGAVSFILPIIAALHK